MDKKGKSGLLMVVVLSVSLVVSTLIYVLGNRYEMKSASGYMYKIDHFTGEVWLVVGKQQYPVMPSDD